MVCGEARVGDVPQIDLELSDAVLGNGAAYRHALLCGRVGYAIQKDGALFDGIHGEIRGAPRGTAAPGHRRKIDAAVSFAPRVDEEELKLTGDHGKYARLLALSDYRTQH